MCEFAVVGVSGMFQVYMCSFNKYRYINVFIHTDLIATFPQPLENRRGCHRPPGPPGPPRPPVRMAVDALCIIVADPEHHASWIQ